MKADWQASYYLPTKYFNKWRTYLVWNTVESKPVYPLAHFYFQDQPIDFPISFAQKKVDSNQISTL